MERFLKWISGIGIQRYDHLHVRNHNPLGLFMEDGAVKRNRSSLSDSEMQEVNDSLEFRAN